MRLSPNTIELSGELEQLTPWPGALREIAQAIVSYNEACQKIAWADRKDFWNHPNLWDGISDPHSQMCWDKQSSEELWRS